MAWKPVSTDAYITVDLEEFDDEALIQELINREYLTECEAQRIFERDGMEEDWDVPDVDMNEISTAWEYAARGNKAEALVHIERALGSEWIGRLT